MSRVIAGAGFMRALATVCALWLPAAPVQGRAPDVYSEQEVRAAFVLRFVGYVEWPPAAASQRRFRILVLGDPALAQSLAKLAAGRTMLGLPVEVSRVTTVRDAADAHVLYVGSDWHGDLRALLRPLAARPVLVVTAEGQALDAGSIINFVHADNRVRFEIAPATARHAGLRISSELLSVAVRLLP